MKNSRSVPVFGVSATGDHGFAFDFVCLFCVLVCGGAWSSLHSSSCNFLFTDFNALTMEHLKKMGRKKQARKEGTVSLWVVMVAFFACLPHLEGMWVK